MKTPSRFISEIRRKKQQKNYRAQHLDTARSTYLLDETTPFAVTEAFRKLKASLSVAIPKKENSGGTSFLLTSTFPEEGKTTITVNLALMFAMSNVKVALVDADIRKGRVSKFFKESSAPGLSDYLSGQATLEKILHPSKINENLYVIYHGTASPRPYELLESETMKELSENLKKQFDYIIYDTPPIRLVSDAIALLPVSDGALMVSRHMKTYESDLKTSLDTLRFAKANLLGIVVNDYFINSKKRKGKMNKYYYSHYAYGDADPENDSANDKKAEKIAPPPALF